MWTKAFLVTLFAAGLACGFNDTRLADAAMQGDHAAVKSLLDQKVDVDSPQGDGTTALHWAAFRDDLDLVKQLLAAGANVKVATREGAITPLFMACTNGNPTMVDVLLGAGAEANSTKTNGSTVLMVAAASGSVETVKALLDHGANVNAKEAVYGQTAVMFAAALNRDAVVKLLASRGADLNVATPVRKLARVRFDQDGNVVDDKAPPKAVGETDPAANEAARNDLETFAHALKLKSAEFRLAKARAKAGDVAARPPRRVGAENQGGMTALLYAAREGHREAVRALVEAGVDMNAANADKITPLVMAILNGHFDLGKYLLEHNADPKAVSSTGLTALYAAIDVQWAPHAWFPQPSVEQEKTSYLELMKELLDKGAPVNAAISEKLWFRAFTNDYTWVDPAGATPFWRAAQSSDVAAMKLLIQYKADPKIATKSGETSLMAAAGIGWAANWNVNAPDAMVDAVKYCADLGVDVNAANTRGYTALHGAAYLGDNEMVNYLVSKGAKVDAKSKSGDTVADMANGPTRYGMPHPETVALLEKLGSGNTHNCRSDQCVVAANAAIYDRPLSPTEQADKDALDRFAVSMGMKSAEYREDLRGGVPRLPGGGQN